MTDQVTEGEREAGEVRKGQFRKGFDPRRNTGGPVSKRKAEFNNLCRQMGVEALETIHSLMTDEENSPRERRQCAEFLIEHGYGKAVDRVAVANLSQNVTQKEQRKLTHLRDALAEVIEGDFNDSSPET